MVILGVLGKQVREFLGKQRVRSRTVLDAMDLVIDGTRVTASQDQVDEEGTLSIHRRATEHS